MLNSHMFLKTIQKMKVFFAFSYPFSYRENQELLAKFNHQFRKDPEIYFHRELLIRSPQNRNIDLVTISSHDGKT